MNDEVRPVRTAADWIPMFAMPNTAVRGTASATTARCSGVSQSQLRSDQVRGARAAFGRGRYSLWTGDAGLAVYFWHCISGEPQFPTVDIL